MHPYHQVPTVLAQINGALRCCYVMTFKIGYIEMLVRMVRTQPHQFGARYAPKLLVQSRIQATFPSTGRASPVFNKKLKL